MHQGRVQDYFDIIDKLDPKNPVDRFKIIDYIEQIETYKKSLSQYAIDSGYQGNEVFIFETGNKLAIIKARLIDNNDNIVSASKKIKWNGNLNELVWLFHQLKNKPTKKKESNKEHYLNYIQCNNEELIDFIFNNFELTEMTRNSVRKYLENTGLQKSFTIQNQ